MRTLKAAALYFALVFGAGFILGTVRVLCVVPRFGTRTAELAEMPMMLVVMILGARWSARRLSLSADAGTRLGVGLGALCLMLCAEFAVVTRLRGLTPGEYLSSRDPVSRDGLPHIAGRSCCHAVSCGPQRLAAWPTLMGPTCAR